MHTCYLCSSLLLSYPDDNIPTYAAIFTTMRSILHAQVGMFQGALYYVM